MASIGPIQPGTPFLPPPRDAKLARRRKDSYDRSSDEAEQSGAASADDDYEAAMLARFPAGSGPLNWLARLIYQTYHSVLRPKLGRIIDILA
jgi:hypothetical protein